MFSEILTIAFYKTDYNNLFYKNVCNSLLQKYESSKDLKKVFKDYKVSFGIFSKSGFTTKLKNLSKANKNLLLFNQMGL